MKLSFVVPVYNVADYLTECLDSLICQDMDKEEYEIIVINDGSTDNSLEIAHRYQRENFNVKVFSQANTGLSMTRNRGVKEAAGKYIWFVDSDDWIATNCLGEVMEKIEKHHFPAMVALSRLKYTSPSQTQAFIESSTDGISGKEFLYKRTYQATTPCYLFKKDFLDKNNLQFLAGIYHEDSEFTPQALFFAEKIIFIEKILYFHRYRAGSITNFANYKRCSDLVVVSKSLARFKVRNCKTPPDKHIFDEIISYTLIYLFSVLYSFKDNKKAIGFLSDLRKEKTILKSFKRSSKPHFKIGYYVLLGCPRLFWRVYSQMEKRRLR